MWSRWTRSTRKSTASRRPHGKRGSPPPWCPSGSSWWPGRWRWCWRRSGCGPRAGRCCREDAMTFARPMLLLLLPVAVGLAAFALARTTRRLRLLAERFGGAEAAGRLTTRDLADFPRRRLRVLGLAVAVMVLAAAGVRSGPGISLNASRPVDVVVALDISASMGARDLPGGRMGRAKEVVGALLEALPGERVGLVVFADWPHTLAPITGDQQVVRFFADSLAENFLGERDQGTRVSAAVGEARRQLDARREEGRERVIVLVTDGEAHEDEFAVADSAALAAAGDVRIWVAGIGTAQG
ncbi:MAG: VWA domain-containing protein, partial [Gammaproteobacteria bacterium]|nr:VWA domain-containing protein [Gammaproteobacteria bacterium]